MSVPGLYSLEISGLQLQVARDEREEPSQVLVINVNHSVLERDMPQNVHAWLLPDRHPDPKLQAEFDRFNHGKPYPWSEATVNNDILATSTALPLTQIPGELEHYELHSFRHEAQPGQYLYIKVDKGLRSFGGYVLGHSFDGVYRVPEYPSELHIAQQGSLLALSGEKALTVLTRGIPAIHVEVGRLLPLQIQHLVSQTEGTFSAPTFKDWTFDAADITERFTDTDQLADAQARYRALHDYSAGPLPGPRRGGSPRNLLHPGAGLGHRTQPAAAQAPRTPTGTAPTACR